MQKGKPLADWILPNEEFTWISLQSGIVVTIKEVQLTNSTYTLQQKDSTITKTDSTSKAKLLRIYIISLAVIGFIGMYLFITSAKKI
ncbi:MAG: hypothetical protein EBU41_04060 [Actinobacteria bacterium]|nr:hypothetical protein [Actinomycetota bacterium]